ncbi:MAG: NAD(P)/FAD-dependent oxidoreductase, partial [Bacteroidota bacterium]
MKERIIIVGAGLCGSLLATLLAKRGFNVTLYERRADMRSGYDDAGRSINLALSARGLLALERVGIKEAILEECIPMHGRMIHPLGEEAFLSRYSGRQEDYINSVSRAGLNMALMDEAEQITGVEIKFNTKVTKVDLASACIEYILEGETYTDQASIVIGTDGAGSVVRRAMMGKTTDLLFNYSQDFLRHGYKELSILPGDNPKWRIEKNALHIWPRGNFMIIALPNLDGSFTLTMFHPFDSDIGFNALSTKEKVRTFFETYFEDLLPFIPHYLD